LNSASPSALIAAVSIALPLSVNETVPVGMPKLVALQLAGWVVTVGAKQVV
jgi:hypothetical protein